MNPIRPISYQVTLRQEKPVIFGELRSQILGRIYHFDQYIIQLRWNTI